MGEDHHFVSKRKMQSVGDKSCSLLLGMMTPCAQFSVCIPEFILCHQPNMPLSLSAADTEPFMGGKPQHDPCLHCSPSVERDLPSDCCSPVISLLKHSTALSIKTNPPRGLSLTFQLSSACRRSQ